MAATRSISIWAAAEVRSEMRLCNATTSTSPPRMTPSNLSCMFASLPQTLSLPARAARIIFTA
eukprot:401033-Alexandrium_andersonii.AAC.1